MDFCTSGLYVKLANTLLTFAESWAVWRLMVNLRHLTNRTTQRASSSTSCVSMSASTTPTLVRTRPWCRCRSRATSSRRRLSILTRSSRSWLSLALLWQVSMCLLFLHLLWFYACLWVLIIESVCFVDFCQKSVPINIYVNSDHIFTFLSKIWFIFSSVAYHSIFLIYLFTLSLFTISMFTISFFSFYVLMSGCEQRVAKVVKESTSETVEPFKTNMTTFVEKGRNFNK